MKKILPSVIGLLFWVSCSKDKTAGALSNATGDTIPAAGLVKYQGTFIPTYGIAVNGTARVVLKGNRYTVALDSFEITAGPDLKVYLSKKDSPSDFINLGALRKTAGNDVYDIPVPVDFTVYKYALIHCQQYNHLFAIAELKP